MKYIFSTLLGLLFLVFTTTANATAVSKDEAKKVAENFFKERILNQQTKWDLASLQITDVTTLTVNGEPSIYVFSNNGNGFILISADNAVTPIMGYAYEGTFPILGEDPNYDSFINYLLDQVTYVRENSVAALPHVSEMWHNYSNSILKTLERAVIASDKEIFVPFVWNQDYPYNYYCPLEVGPGGRCYAGCVATTMSVIMAYYRYPEVGNGQSAYYHPLYGTQSANYGETHYGWDKMLISVKTSDEEAMLANALLQRHTGVSVRMDYGGTVAGGSGALSQDVPYALKTYFKYSPSVAMVQRGGMSVAQWENVFLTELDQYRPLYYAGKEPSANAGHAFVCDGYQETGSGKQFHFKFGWSGSGDGFYPIDNPNGYSANANIIKNFIPDPAQYPYGCSDKTLDYYIGSFEDGSSPIANYKENLSCTWLIAPTDTISKLKLSFSRFDVHSSDKLIIYDGPNDTYPVLAELTGNTLPDDISTTSHRAFLKFITDGSGTGRGWEIFYKGNKIELCSGSKTFKEPEGVFDDGSGDMNYQNNASCQFRISPPYAKDIKIEFLEFDLEENDILKVYKFGNSTPLAELTGNTIPDPITIPDGTMMLLFNSDHIGTAQGFKVKYTIGNISTQNIEGIDGWNLIPNPAKDYTYINAQNDKEQYLNVVVSDFTGSTIQSETFKALPGEINYKLDTKNLKPGMYMISILNGKQKVTKKLIIQ